LARVVNEQLAPTSVTVVGKVALVKFPTQKDKTNNPELGPEWLEKAGSKRQEQTWSRKLPKQTSERKNNKARQ